MKLHAVSILLLASAIAPEVRAQAPGGKTYLLGVSVKRYDQSKTGFIDLDRAAPDVVSVVNSLWPEGARPTVAIHLAQYKDEPAVRAPTAAGVRAALKDLAARVTEKDRVVVTMLGHGINTKQGDIFCTGDCDFADPKSMLAVVEVVARVKAMKALEKIVFIDACRKITDHYQVRDAEGKLLYDRGNQPLLKEIVVDVEMPAKPDDSVTRPETRDPSRMVVVQSCKVGQRTFISGETGQAIFSGRLLEAVKGAADSNADGTVTTQEVLEYLQKSVREDARTMRQEVQEIEVRDHGLGSVFDLVAYAKGKAAHPFKPAVAKPELPPDYYRAPLGDSGYASSTPVRSYGPGVGDRFAQSDLMQLGKALNQSSFGPLPNPIPGHIRPWVPNGEGGLFNKVIGSIHW